jgi:RNA polymerase sigma-70 factor (ECF subfamily)
MSGADIKQVVEAASGGDPLAVDELLERYLPGLRAFIRLRAGKTLRAKESTADLVQSVCREVLQNADRFQYRGEAGFKSWLFTTALRKLSNRRDYYHAARRDADRESPLVGHPDSRDEDLLAAYGNLCTPSRGAVAREELERVERAFEELSDSYRDVILQSRVLGLSHQEIADASGRSVGATRTHLSRALSALAEQLDA